MINIAEVRNTFRQRVKYSGIVPVSSIEYENQNFEPEGKTVWVRESYLPANEDPVTSNIDALSGVLVYTVFTPKNAGDTLAVSTGVAIGNLWETQEIITTDNYRTSVSRTYPMSQASYDDIWYQYSIGIEIRVEN